MSYYKQFKIISNLPFWNAYLHWAYEIGLHDAKMLGAKSSIMDKNFTCLLSGVSGEITANAFLQFVLSKNKNAKIYIIDFGKEQIESVKKLVKENYPHTSIVIKKTNALDLSHIANKSIDWIETDGFIEYFDDEALKKLLKEWKRVLRKDGFITTREFASSGFVGMLVDKVRIWLGKVYLHGIMHLHRKKDLQNHFLSAGFMFSIANSPFFTYKRFALVQ